MHLLQPSPDSYFGVVNLWHEARVHLQNSSNGVLEEEVGPVQLDDLHSAPTLAICPYCLCYFGCRLLVNRLAIRPNYDLFCCPTLVFALDLCYAINLFYGIVALSTTNFHARSV